MKKSPLAVAHAFKSISLEKVAFVALLHSFGKCGEIMEDLEISTRKSSSTVSTPLSSSATRIAPGLF